MRRYMLPVILLLCDILSLCISIWFAIVLRFAETGANYQAYISRMVVAMPVYLFCHVIFFFAFKLYNRVWKYAGIKEMISIVGANVLGMALFLVTRLFVLPMSGNTVLLSKMLMLLVCFFNISLVAVSRLFVRWAGYQVEKGDKENDTVDKRVLIVGAGDAGNIILRDLRQRDHRYVIGFIDDDETKRKKIMNGIPVLGGRKDIKRIVEEKGIGEIIIAIPSLEIDKLSELAEICSSSGENVAVKVLPSFFTSMDEVQINYQTLRPLQIEDLLKLFS